MVQTVESERSKASDINDMKLILDNIKAFKSKTGGESGAKGVDKEIKDAIVLSVEHEVERARKLGGGPLARALLKASIIHWTAQRRSEALGEAEESCDIFKRVHAGAHRDKSIAVAIKAAILMELDRPTDRDELVTWYGNILHLFNEVLTMERQLARGASVQSHFLAVALSNVATIQNGLNCVQFANQPGEKRDGAEKCLALSLESISVYINSEISHHYPEKRRLQELSLGLVSSARYLQRYAVNDFNYIYDNTKEDTSDVLNARLKDVINLVKHSVTLSNYANMPEGGKKALRHCGQGLGLFGGGICNLYSRSKASMCLCKEGQAGLRGYKSSSFRYFWSRSKI